LNGCDYWLLEASPLSIQVPSGVILGVGSISAPFGLIEGLSSGRDDAEEFSDATDDTAEDVTELSEVCDEDEDDG
jgi:hypothetical protein